MAQTDDLNKLQDIMVHEDQPLPEGWKIYASLKYVCQLVMISYGVLIALVGVGMLVMPDSGIFLMSPAAVVLAAPVAIGALYLNMTTRAETGLAAKRTKVGRLVSFAAVLAAFLAGTQTVGFLLYQSLKLI